jgi:hypothetical protein
MVSYLGSLADDDSIHVANIPSVAHNAPDFPKQLNGVGVLETLVGIGEVVADIFQARSSEQCVGYGVGQYVSVRVTGEATVEGDGYSAQDQGSPGLRAGERVYVHPETHPEAQRRAP